MCVAEDDFEQWKNVCYLAGCGCHKGLLRPVATDAGFRKTCVFSAANSPRLYASSSSSPSPFLPFLHKRRLKRVNCIHLTSLLSVGIVNLIQELSIDPSPFFFVSVIQDTLDTKKRKRLLHFFAAADTFKYYFFLHMIPEWNALPTA